jgi:HAE1 family hydrophobic/amphiphilic exporter-1
VKFTHFFVDRPIFAAVLSIFITLMGALAYRSLPISQYPEVAPPTVQVRAAYPGASAEVVADSVAAPLEQEINGVENMLYMHSQSTGDGNLSITVTFALGTDLDEAQVQVQNRIALAEPRLPESVRRLGVSAQKNSPDILMVFNLYSPEETYDRLYIANYAVLRLRDTLARIDGVGRVRLLGASEYAMRVWLDPDRVDAVGLTAGDVVQALRTQNLQVAAGVMNQPPSSGPEAFQIGVQTQGRLMQPEEFGEIVIRATDDGSIVRLRDVARIELGAQSYSTSGYLGRQSAVALAIDQRPGSNALATANKLRATMERLAQDFPQGMTYDIGYNPTEFVQASVDAVIETIFEAIALVVLVVILFLQNFRTALIPILAIPVSLVGTFAVMATFGFSLNNLTLFGLVLAIGIVVDDAIVVVENIERNLRKGLAPREAAHRTMDEVGTALVAIALVLSAVFIPAAFVSGITGQFFRQFALTIASATIISAIVSLTLSPALAALILKPAGATPALSRVSRRVQRACDGFNRGLERVAGRYARLVSAMVRRGAVVAGIYFLLIGLAGVQYSLVPSGFIPTLDQGYAMVAVQLPPGAKFERTEQVVTTATDKLLAIEGVKNTVGFVGFSALTSSTGPNVATMFVAFMPYAEREAKGILFEQLLAQLRGTLATIGEASLLVINPPPVRGLGYAGGFRMMLQDQNGRGLDTLAAAAADMAGTANQTPGLTRVFTLFDTRTPQLYLDVDRVRAEQLGVPVENVFEALEVYFGSTFINDFNFLGRTFQVTAQADAEFRRSPRDLLSLRTRNRTGEAVPLGSVAIAEYRTAPYRVERYNLYPAVSIFGSAAPGAGSGEALASMEALAAEQLPDGLGFEWTDLAYQQKAAGDVGMAVFALAVLCVFLVLAAQYESWMLPLAIVLIVPMCILSALFGVWLTGWDNNVLVKVGLIVLVGLAAKNAILIVEFARQEEAAGSSRFEAASNAARLRLRPILMTSLAFILGVVPLVFGVGPGAEMRQILGITVFSGMLGVTAFGLLFTPVFYVLCRRVEQRLSGKRVSGKTAPPASAVFGADKQD